MVFPDLERWRLTFPLELDFFFFVPYTLDFRKCTKQDNTAQYISCVSFFFFKKRDKNTWKSSDISTQGCSVFPFFVFFCILYRPTVALHNVIVQRYPNLTRGLLRLFQFEARRMIKCSSLFKKNVLTGNFMVSIYSVYDDCYFPEQQGYKLIQSNQIRLILQLLPKAPTVPKSDVICMLKQSGLTVPEPLCN